MHYCEKCEKQMDDKSFYTYKNGEKVEQCKKCLTMHIDNFKPETYTWLLKKMDVPYIPGEWNVLRDKAFAKNPNLNGMSVFGKYLSKMRLNQYKEYGWADSEELNNRSIQRTEEEIAERKAMEENLKQQYEAGEISEFEYKTLVSTNTQNEEEKKKPIMPVDAIGVGNAYDENNFIAEDDLPDPGAELTNEDKIYLAMKWGRLYKASEWVELERQYNEMSNSFDIQDADSINALILICKTNLKANQALDCGDIDGFQKLSRVLDSLRKSAKFTAAQNKEGKSDAVDSIGEFVELCEREGGFIPRFATDIPQDKVDLTLKDMNNYLYKLVTQDLGFGQQIEDSLRKIQIQKEMNAAEEAALNDEELDAQELVDRDFEEFYSSEAEQRDRDNKIYEGDE